MAKDEVKDTGAELTPEEEVLATPAPECTCEPGCPCDCEEDPDYDDYPYEDFDDDDDDLDDFDDDEIDYDGAEYYDYVIRYQELCNFIGGLTPEDAAKVIWGLINVNPPI